MYKLKLKVAAILATVAMSQPGAASGQIEQLELTQVDGDFLLSLPSEFIGGLSDEVRENLLQSLEDANIRIDIQEEPFEAVNMEQKESTTSKAPSTFPTVTQ